MKHILIMGLIALSSLAAHAADTPDSIVIDGHQYKLAEAASIPAPTPVIINDHAHYEPTSTPVAAAAPTPGVTVNIYNNQPQQQVQQTQASAGTVEIPQAPTFTYSASPYDFIVSIISAVNNHDWRALAPFIADGHCYYFGDRKATLSLIAREMRNDFYRYGEWRAIYDPSSFSREVSKEYSRNWEGPMIYDNITAYVGVNEPGVRWHRAMERWSVGYTYVDGNLRIYALVFKVL
jgi:hypothetical protein